jgi:hypothetical protein
MKSLFIASVWLAGAVCAGYAPQNKSVHKTPPEHSTVTCPDAEAQQACKSYQELLKAKDPGLPASGSFICFRKNMDQFFVVHISKPYFPKHWDKELKQMVADESARPGSGYAHTYKDGVLDLGTMPYLFFSGQWQPILYSDSGIFASDKINRTMQDVNDPDVGISIDETQVNVGYKYKNRFEKTILYTLTIQRSTGRFAESFLEEAAKFPFSQNVGYCAYH